MLCTCRQEGDHECEAIMPVMPSASDCNLAADTGRAFGLHHSCVIWALSWQPHSELISELAATL